MKNISKTDKIIFTFRLCVLIGIASIRLDAQTPVLVEDFNPGPESSFNFHTIDGENYHGELKSINYKGKLIFPIYSTAFGEELGVLEDDDISLLKDISPGIWSSKPKHFIKYKGELYFTARDSLGSALYKTDSTSEGTVFVFRPPTNDPTSEISPLVVSKEQLMYFTRNKLLFVFDGVDAQQIGNGIEFESNFCLYKEGVAVVQNESNINTSALDPFSFYHITDAGVNMLAEFLAHGDVHALAVIKAGLYIGTGQDNSPVVYEDFIYDELTENLIAINTDNQRKRKIGVVQNEEMLIWRADEGIFIKDGVSDDVFLYEDIGSFGAFENRVKSAAYNGNFLFQGEKLLSEDLVFYNAANSETDIVFNIDGAMSNLLTHNEYVFFATGIYNNRKPEFYYFNMIDSTYTNFFSSEETSLGWSVLLMGIIDGKLYFVSKLDEDVGTELYSVDLDVISSTFEDNALEEPYFISSTTNTITLESPEKKELQLYIYDTSGTLIQTSKNSTNERISTAGLRGVYVFAFNVNGKTISKLVYRN